MIVLIIVLVAALVLLVGWFVLTRNGIVAHRNSCEQLWADVATELKRRHDLIPNLVETVKGYATHERQVFERVTKARAEAMSARTIEDAQTAEGKLSGALVDLRAVAEGYPQLRASENFQQLQSSLADTETRIQRVRLAYNAMAQRYNTRIQIVPNVFVARLGGFEPSDYFELASSVEGEAPEVSFESA